MQSFRKSHDSNSLFFNYESLDKLDFTPQKKIYPFDKELLLK